MSTQYSEVPIDLQNLLPQLEALAGWANFEIAAGHLLCSLSWAGDAPGDDPRDTVNEVCREAKEIVAKAGYEIGQEYLEHDYCSFEILGKLWESGKEAPATMKPVDLSVATMSFAVEMDGQAPFEIMRIMADKTLYINAQMLGLSDDPNTVVCITQAGLKWALEANVAQLMVKHDIR